MINKTENTKIYPNGTPIAFRSISGIKTDRNKIMTRWNADIRIDSLIESSKLAKTSDRESQAIFVNIAKLSKSPETNNERIMDINRIPIIRYVDIE
jgi:hypothetical protein